MNDFTKEELNQINYWLEMVRENCACEGEHPIIFLIAKLKSMIDNYCDHENQSSTSDVDYVEYCRDCDQITGIK